MFILQRRHDLTWWKASNTPTKTCVGITRAMHWPELAYTYHELTINAIGIWQTRMRRYFVMVVYSGHNMQICYNTPYSGFGLYQNICSANNTYCSYMCYFPIHTLNRKT